MAKFDDTVVTEDQYVQCAPETPMGSPVCNSHSPACKERPQDEELSSTGHAIAQGSPLSATPSTQLARRKAASEVIQAATGVAVQFETDQAFRNSLKDGMLLCKMANALMGLDIQCLEACDISEFGPQGLLRQRAHNVNSFLASLEQQLQPLPVDCRFTIADLEAEGDTERPQVANCLLYMKAVYQPQPTTDVPAAGADNQLPSTPACPYTTAMWQQQQQYHSSPNPMQMQQTQQRLSFGSPGMLAPLNFGARASLQQSSPAQQALRRSCGGLLAPSNSPLRDSHGSLSHSGNGSFNHNTSIVPARTYTRDNPATTNTYGPDENAVKALGPVLEGVLGTLTEEYEKRLLAKDHDFSRMCDAKAKLEKEVDRLQVENRRLHDELVAMQDVEEKYKHVLEENRNLYNTVQDLRGNIRVFCRIRPPGATGDLSPCCVDVGMEGDLAVYDLQNGAKRVFKVDRVFGAHTDQLAVYEDTQPLIRSVLDGYNVCIFAYGQTGSGKTHTMSGTMMEQEDGRGINYRALDDLFAIRDSRLEEASYSFRVQMLEIYNEQLRDLLADGRSAAASRLDILATQASGCNVPGATQVEVETAADVSRLMALGASQRATSETRMNDRSSRSHQILTVIVEGLHQVTKARSHACLHLIDLAGSERVGKSEASGDRLVEAQHINKSLSALGDVMAALAAKDKHVPYRNSKLTQLLQDSLQGQAKVMMFMHVSPEANMFGESVSTLKFAARVADITLGQAKKNVVSGQVFEAHEQVLKQQRSMESKDQQVQQLQAALQHKDAENQGLQQAIAQLRQQLETETSAAAGEALPAVSGPAPVLTVAKERAKFHLPIQEMLAAQASGFKSPRSSGLSSRDAAPSSLSARRLSAGAAPALLSEQPGLGQPGSPASIGKMSKTLDRTPSRDQGDDNLRLPSARCRPTPEVSPLGQHCINGYKSSGTDPLPLMTPRTARSSSNSSMPVRESISSQRHLERLQSARQSGSFKTASSAGPSGFGVGGGVSVKQFVEAVRGVGSVSAGPSKLSSSNTAGNSGLSRQSSFGGAAAPASRRSRGELAVPQTSRVSGVVKSRVAELTQAAGTMSMRQSGFFRSNSAGGSSGSAGMSSGLGASGSVTSRAGSRWK
eukprot:gene5972-6211_t